MKTTAILIALSLSPLVFGKAIHCTADSDTSCTVDVASDHASAKINCKGFSGVDATCPKPNEIPLACSFSEGSQPSAPSWDVTIESKSSKNKSRILGPEVIINSDMTCDQDRLDDIVIVPDRTCLLEAGDSVAGVPVFSAWRSFWRSRVTRTTKFSLAPRARSKGVSG